jgi:hypothetical protein
MTFNGDTTILPRSQAGREASSKSAARHPAGTLR